MRTLAEETVLRATIVLENKTGGSHDEMLSCPSKMQKAVEVMIGSVNLTPTVIDEIKVTTNQPMETIFEINYLVEGYEIAVVELDMTITVVANPIKSALVDQMVENTAEIKEKMDKLGYKCSQVMKKEALPYSGIISRRSKRASFKPKSALSSKSIKKAIKNKSWSPELIRTNRNGSMAVPAVLFV